MIILREKYSRNIPFDIIVNIVLLTIANYYVGEYTTYVEIVIVTWLFWRFIYLRKYDFQINNENINFYNSNINISWNDVTKITFLDGQFVLDSILDFDFYNIAPPVQINIEYEQNGKKGSFKFLSTRYDYWQEVIKKIKQIIESKGIVYEKHFKFSGTDSYIWGTKEEKKKATKSSMVLGAVIFMFAIIKVIRYFSK